MFLTIQQLAERWLVSCETVRRHIRAGRLSAVNLGTGSHQVLRVTVDDAKAFEDRRSGVAPKYTANRVKREKPARDYLS